MPRYLIGIKQFIMKAKHMKQRLENRINWYDKQDQRYKDAHKRPGSIKGR